MARFSVLALAFTLAGAVFGAPTRSPRASRGVQTRQSRVARYNEDVGGWAGVAYSESNGTFVTVSGTIQVPNISYPSGADDSTQYGAAFWVGIDGFGNGALLQTGISGTIQNGEVGYDAWYEWIPAGSVNFDSDISFSPGDTVVMSVTATSTTTGNATVINQSTGVTASTTVSGTNALYQATAEWIVEDYGISGGSIPFAEFSPVTFSDASAVLTDGDTWGLANGQVLDMTNPDSSENSDVFATSAVNGEDLTVTYVASS